jgi:hypothetical protein
MKDAVQLALRQNPQRLIARLIVSERNQDKNIAQSAILPQVNVVAGESVNSYNSQSIAGGPKPVRVGPFQAVDAGGEFSLDLFNMSLTRRYQASRRRTYRYFSGNDGKGANYFAHRGGVSRYLAGCGQPGRCGIAGRTGSKAL